MVKRETKYQIGQFVRIKDTKTLVGNMDVNGLIVGIVGYWEGTEQGYGILTDSGEIRDFKEDELAPMTSANQLYKAMKRATICLESHWDEVSSNARFYWKSITL